MQVTNHSNNIRKMKEEMLEAIYGTVEREIGAKSR